VIQFLQMALFCRLSNEEPLCGTHRYSQSLCITCGCVVSGVQCDTPCECGYFGSLNLSVHRGHNKRKLTLVTPSGSAFWERVSQADSCHFEFHCLGTMHFIFGKREKQRRREHCRQIYICFSIYAKPLALHHLS
jgi:hypothetical protein